MQAARKLTTRHVKIFSRLFLLVSVLGMLSIAPLSAYADEAELKTSDLPVAAPTAPAAAAAPAATNPFQFILGSVNFFLLAFFVYYMMVLRPAQLKEEESLRFMRALKKDDEVVTSGGIIGRVRDLTGDYLGIEIASGVRIRVLRDHVSAVPTKTAENAPVIAAAAKKG